MVGDIHSVLLNPTLIKSDGIHPTAEGHKELAYAVASTLTGGTVSIHRVDSTTISAVDNVSSITGSKVYFQQINNACKMLAPALETVTYSSTQSFSTNGGTLTIGKLTCSPVKYYDNNYFIEQQYILYQDQNNIWHRLFGGYNISDHSKLVFIVKDVTDTQTAFSNLLAKALYVPAFTMDIPF